MLRKAGYSKLGYSERSPYLIHLYENCIKFFILSIGSKTPSLSLNLASLGSKIFEPEPEPGFKP